MQINKKQFDPYLVLALILGVVSILFLGAFVSSSEQTSATGETITVYAAAGTMMAMQAVAQEYEKQTGCKIELNFASSSTLARQIVSGAQFDVFISANSKWMNHLEDKALVDSTLQRDLISDRLALIAPADSKLPLKEHSINRVLAYMNGSIALGDPLHVPCGLYAKEALSSLKCWDAIQSRVIPASSVRIAQQYVENGQCELGIVYEAGAMQSNDVKILSVLNESLHTPIRFSAASAIDSILGNEFLAFLSQSSAMNIFIEAGFTPCNPIRPFRVHQGAPVEPAFEVDIWQTLIISIKVAATCTIIVAVPGIWLGYILARKVFPGRSLVNACVHLPMVVPPVVTGYLALMMLGKNSVFGTWLYDTFGVSIAFTWVGAVVVSAVMGLPMLVRSVKTAFEMIDQRYAQAAGTLGASPFVAFLTVTVPLAGPGILSGLVLAFARCLGEFGATAIFAGNIPNKTQTLSLAIYSYTQIPGAESSVANLVGISILVSFFAMLGSEFLNQRMKHLAGVG